MTIKLKLGVFGFLAAAGGIVTAAAWGIHSLYWLLAGLLCIALAIFIYLRRFGLHGWIIFAFFFCAGGFLFGSGREAYRAELRINQQWSGKILALEGVQVERAVPTRFGYRMVLDVKPVGPGSPVGRISISSRNPFPASGYGRYLKIRGKFKAVVESKAAWPETLERNRISGLCYIHDSPQLVRRNGRSFGLPFYFIWADRLRARLMRQGDRGLKPANARLLHGMVYNDRLNDEDEEIVAGMRRTGTIHLLSVSGLHIGFIVLGLNFILGWLRCPRKWRALPLGLGVWFYILMTGMNPPVLRAGLMMLLFSAAECFGTRDGNVNRLSLAGLILVLFNPGNLFEIGFQLSFLATLGVVWIFPLLKEYFPAPERFQKFRPVKPIWQAVLVSTGAQSLVIPVIVHYFQMISWSATLVNLILLIPAEIIVMGGFVGEMAGAVFPPAGPVVLMVVDWTLQLTRTVVGFFGSRPWPASAVPRWPWPWFVAYYLGLVVLFDWLRPNRLNGRRMIRAGAVAVILLVVLNGVVWAAFLDKSVNDDLQVSCLDVGQGDAIYVKTPEGKTALIDGGDEGEGRRRILPFLRQMGVGRLDLVIGTHGHKDHVGGLPEIFKEIPTKTLILPGQDTPDMRVFLDRLPEVKMERIRPGQSRKIRLGPSVTLEILAVSAPESSSENDQSLITIIHYGNERFLLTGDLEFAGESALMRQSPERLRADFLKVGHHGSNYSTGLEFLAQVRPKVALISVGAGNDFGHPGKETLNRLRSMGVRVYRTDRNGRVDVRVKARPGVGGEWVVGREK